MTGTVVVATMFINQFKDIIVSASLVRRKQIKFQFSFSFIKDPIEINIKVILYSLYVLA